MANKLYEEDTIKNIAQAIRTQTGKTDKMLVSDMADEVSKIDTSNGSVSVENGIVVNELNDEGEPSEISIYGDFQSSLSMRSSVKKINLINANKVGSENGTYINYGTFCGVACSEFVFPSTVDEINAYTFGGCDNLKTITFKGTPKTIDANALADKSMYAPKTNIVTINVPWSEGEVANAPWGASNATINYNYVG